MARVLLAVHAMATRFELVLHGGDVAFLRAAGEEALAEIGRVEALLSAFRDSSDIGRINRHAAEGPVRVAAETCRVIERCRALSHACDGAFDITVGPLVRLWRTSGEEGRLPDPRALDEARRRVGMERVLVDTAALTVRLDAPGMALDLGAAGKGYAIDLAIAALRDAGVTSALLHGGTSSVHAIGAPPDADGWRVAWASPDGAACLRDDALAVSAPHGRAWTIDGHTVGHVVDPRTGQPVAHATAAGVTGPSSLECDALSTALLVLGRPGLATIAECWPGTTGWALPAQSPAAH